MFRIAVAAALAGATVLAGVPTQAAEFPEKNIEFVIPYSTGGGFDRTVRLVSPYLEKALPKKVDVLPTNMPGAGGRKAMATVFRAKPDGYTIGIANIPGAAIPQFEGEKVAYDINKFTWVAKLASENYVAAVAAKSPIHSLEDLRKLGRPVKITNTDFGSTAYAAGQILGEVLKFPIKNLTGYKGTNDAIVAVVRGDGDLALTPISTMEKFIKSGEVRAIFTTEDKSSLKGVPTVAELGGAQAAGLAVDRFVVAPPNLPAEITKILSASLMKAAGDPALVKAAEKSGESWQPLPTATAQANANKSLALYAKYKSVIARQ
jgi:tripartite-type tricarboxylate transporter receptor subunit TctC